MKIKKYLDEKGNIIDVVSIPTLFSDSILTDSEVQEGIKNLNGIIYYRRIETRTGYKLEGEYFPNPQSHNSGKLDINIVKKFIRMFKKEIKVMNN
ncbi:MAG: hypothetical protein ACTSX4_02760 [Candidatus Helarchaeota archaeon]